MSDHSDSQTSLGDNSPDVSLNDLNKDSKAQPPTNKPASSPPKSFFKSFLKSLVSLAKRFFQGIALLPVPLFVFSLLGRYFYFAELLGNFRGYLMITLLIAIAIFALSRRWWLAAFTVPVFCWSMIGVLSVLWPADQPPPGSEKLRIMSFNVLGSNFRHDLAVDQIRLADPDVVSILEYSGNWHHPMDCLNERYPHQIRIPRWHGFGIAMFSTYPFSESQEFAITKKETDAPIIVANVVYGSKTQPEIIRLAAIHVLSPTNEYRMGLRNQQFAEVADLLAKDDVPTVVMGDFNCVPWSPFLNDFLKTTNYRDSRQGFGYHATWDTKLWPIQIPIDHAFVSKDVHVHDRYVGDYGGSDHYPIVLEVSLSD